MIDLSKFFWEDGTLLGYKVEHEENSYFETFFIKDVNGYGFKMVPEPSLTEDNILSVVAIWKGPTIWEGNDGRFSMSLSLKDIEDDKFYYETSSKNERRKIFDDYMMQAINEAAKFAKLW